MGSGLYNPLLMATPFGGPVFNEQFHLQFNARSVMWSTQNVVNFSSAPEDATHDGPRTFMRIYGGSLALTGLTPPFKAEFSHEIPMLNEARLRRVRARLITSMPVNTVSMYLRESDAFNTVGKKIKFIFDFPTPTAPGDQFIFPITGSVNIRLKKGKFYYWMFEFDDLIPRTTNFGIAIGTDIWFGDGAG